MKSIGIAGLALLAMISTAAAQDGREAAIEEIARALAELEETMPSQSEIMTAEASALQERIVGSHS